MNEPGYRPDLDHRAVGPAEAFDRLPVYRLFERTAARQPDAPALVWDDGGCSYGELDALANRYAAAIRASGHRRGEVVALALPRGVAMIAALIGAQKAGAIYLPVDPAFPPGRVDTMLADSGVATVVAPRADAKRWQADGRRVIAAEDLPEDLPDAAPPLPAQGAGWDDPMYIIYTSGTTGRAKGILQMHRTIGNLVQWQNTASGIAFGGRTLQFASFGFDVYLQELFSPLTVGGTVVLIGERDRVSTAAVAACIRRHAVGTIFLPVAVLGALFDDPAQLPDTITDIVTAGEPLVVSSRLRAFLETRPDLRLHNHYGVSESHVVTQSSYSARTGLVEHPTLGRPIANTRLAILAEDGRPTRDDAVGEIWIAGDCLAEGYIGLPEKTAELFRTVAGERWYRTGDFGAFLPDGAIRFTGRRDDQVKISGHLVVLSEVEAAILQHPDVRACACTVMADSRSLAAHVVTEGPLRSERLRAHAAERLPAFAVPSRFVRHDRLPTGATGKVERRALAVPERLDRDQMAAAYVPPSDETGRAIVDALSQALSLDGIGMDDTFAALGLNSLRMIRAARLLGDRLGRPVDPLRFFECATPGGLRSVLAGGARPASVPARARRTDRIAIIGMAGLFPGAGDVAALWRGMLGEETLLTLRRPGERPRSALIPDKEEPPRWIGPIEGATRFEAALFGLSPREALWMDPQQRKFLEQSWRCFEDAGIDPTRAAGRVGVFAGSAESAYLFHVQPRIATSLDYLAAVVGSDKDFLATRVAYHLGLRGPALNVQSACSTGLVAVHQACAAIRAGDCDMALAGAASILLPPERDIPYEADAIFSEDGLTRPFDRRRGGTTMTNAVAAVLLKPLEAALRDDDPIHAVVRGTGINNDADRKAGFAAPSVAGQAEAIRAALAAAGLDPSQIGFVETHGTATKLGDEVELAALRAVFGTDGAAGRCALTSVKSRLGHTNRAAGVVGLIAAAQALSHRTLPAMAHVSAPDPALRLDESPFRIPARPEPLAARGPVYAGVSSFGIGGTNAHVILETAPPRTAPPELSQPELVLLSARTPERLVAQAAALAEACGRSTASLQSIARTLNQGRARLACRAAVVADGKAGLAAALRALGPESAVHAPEVAPRVAFLFPGVGPEYAGMGRALYRRNETYRRTVDEAAGHLSGSGLDLAAYFRDDAAIDLRRSSVSHTLLLTAEVAAGRALADLGLAPALMLGLSGGEFACAVLADHLEFGEALDIVRERGRLMDETTVEGGAVTTMLPVEEAAEFARGEVSVAGVLTRRHTLLAGPRRDIDALCERLERAGVNHKRLVNPNANHTPLMRPAAERLAARLARVAFRPRAQPYVSGMTGEILAAGTADGAQYWIDHLCRPIAFAAGLDRLASEGCTHLLELGPRDTMCRLAQAHFPGRADLGILPVQIQDREVESFAEALGAYWCAGGALDIGKLAMPGVPRCAGLPGTILDGPEAFLAYDGAASARPGPAAEPDVGADTDCAEQVWRRILEPRPPLAPADFADLADLAEIGRDWCVVGDGARAQALAAALGGAGLAVTARSPTEAATGDLPPRLLLIVPPGDPQANLLTASRWLSALGGRGRALACLIAFDETDGAPTMPDPGLATAAIVAGMENDALACRFVTFGRCAEPALWLASVADEVVDLGAGPTDRTPTAVVVYRGRRRTVEVMRPEPRGPAEAPPALSGESVVLLTGAMGGVGRALSRTLAGAVGCRLVLTGRRDGATDPVIAAQLATLRAAGAEAIYAACDVTDADALAALLDGVKARWGRLDAVLHLAAAIEEDGFLCFLPELTPERLAHQCTPKVEGVRALDTALRRTGLAPRRIAFSSIAVTLGGLGYAAYAFSNRMLLAAACPAGWQVVHWDVWQRDGREGDRSKGDRSKGDSGRIALGSSLGGVGLSGAEALRAVQRVLADGQPEAAVFKVAPEARRSTAPPAGAPAEAVSGEPSGGLIDVVREVWCRHLAVADLPADADFLRYGGDSLSGIGVTLDLRKRLNLPIGPDLLLRHPRLDAFLSALTDLRAAAAHEGPSDEGPAADAPCPAVARYRASPLQSRWFAMHGAGYGTLVMPMLLRGAVDRARLHRAVEAALRRFAVLRTVYGRDADGTVWAEVLPESRSPTLETAAVDAGDAPALKAWAAALEATPVPLRQDPPFRGWLVDGGADGTLLVFHTHHICFDGWSAGLLADEIRRQYEGAPEAPAPAYAEVAAAAWTYLEGPEGTARREEWRRLFRGAPAPARPAPDGPGGEDRAAHKAWVAIAAGDAARLRARAAADGVTLFTALLAGFARLLAESSGARDLVFGTTSFGRATPDVAAVVGVFVNPLPLRLDVDPADPGASALASARRASAMVQASMRYPITDLAAEIDPFRGRPLNDAFVSYLLFQNFRRPLAWRDLDVTIGEPDDACDLAYLDAFSAEDVTLMRHFEIIVFERPDGTLSINVWGRKSLYSLNRLRTLGKRFAELLL